MARRSARIRRRQRWLDYPLQALPLALLLLLFRILPVDWASGLGGFLARRIGPRLGSSRKAARNLARAMPELDDAARRAVIAGMWENLGRVAGEYPHIGRIWSPDPKDSRVEFVGAENAHAVLASGKPAVFFSGHLANWELLTLLGDRLGTPMALIYRRPNNPLVARLLEGIRLQSIDLGELHPKGREGARALLTALKKGHSIGLLVDQKLNDGLPVPFFGRDAMTAPAIAQFALHFKTPPIPARIERLGGARFRVTIQPPLPLPQTGDRTKDTRLLLDQVNARLETWVRERPEQWLWLHRRWPN